MTKDPHIIKSGHLSVGNGHEIYWEDWGNPKGTPIFHLHGGPGAGFSQRHKILYDPKKHRVIFHDQRGCGKSTPFGEIKHNTTQDLISDIEKLRTHLGIEKMHVVGGSWGSTLTLFYTLAHPNRVLSTVIWSVFLARQFELDFLTEGYPKYFFPEEWERFISLVPEKHRKNGDSVLRYYAEKIHATNDPETAKFIDEWALWESTLVSILYNRELTVQRTIGDRDNISMSKLETHYFINDCFVPKGYILDTLGKIKHIPCVVVQGRFDMCTPPISAYDLARAYGDKLTLHVVNAGHLRTEPEMLATLRAVTAGLV